MVQPAESRARKHSRPARRLFVVGLRQLLDRAQNLGGGEHFVTDIAVRIGDQCEAVISRSISLRRRILSNTTTLAEADPALLMRTDPFDEFGSQGEFRAQ